MREPADDLPVQARAWPPAARGPETSSATLVWPERTYTWTSAARARVKAIPAVSARPSPLGEKATGEISRNPSVRSTTIEVEADASCPGDVASTSSVYRPSGRGAPSVPLPFQDIVKGPAQTERSLRGRATAVPAWFRTVASTVAEVVSEKERVVVSPTPSPFSVSTFGAASSFRTVSGGGPGTRPEAPRRSGPSIEYV